MSSSSDSIRTMKPRFIVLAAIIGLGYSFAFAQTVVITPKKTVYRRPKPLYAFKRTFTIRRPIAKASTPAISRAITKAISPESVLEINIKEELTEYQWLEEADYKLLFNQNGILCLELWMSGTAAYPDSVTKRVVVDIRKGVTVRSEDVLKNLTGLAALVRNAQLAEVSKATKEMESDPDAKPK